MKVTRIQNSVRGFILTVAILAIFLFFHSVVYTQVPEPTRVKKYDNTIGDYRKGIAKDGSGNSAVMTHGFSLDTDWIHTNGPYGGEIYAMARHPLNFSIMYIGTNLINNKAGVFKSQDNGLNWLPIVNGLSTEWAPDPIWSIAINPQFPDIIYLGKWREIYKSIDGGETWNICSGDLPKSIFCNIRINPLNTNILFLISTDYGVYRSTDGGNSWFLVLPLQTSPYYSFIKIDPQNPSVIYAGPFTNENASGFYKSIDGGVNWDFRASFSVYNPIYSLALDPNDSNNLVVGTSNGIYRSSDGGQIWNQVSFYNDATCIEVYPSVPSTFYAGSMHKNEGLSISTDAGITWTSIDYKGGKVLSILRGAHSPEEFFIGTWGGIFKTTDKGSTWNRLSFWGSTPLSIALSPYSSSILYAGCSRAGLQMSNDAGMTWLPLDNGISLHQSVSSIAFDPVENDVIYCTADGYRHDYHPDSLTSFVYKSINSGQTWFQIMEGLPYAASSKITPVNSSVLYLIFGNRIYKSVNGGNHWYECDNGGMPDEVNCLAFSPSNTNILYVGLYQYPTNPSHIGVYKSLDGGDAWLPVGLFGVDVRTLVVDPGNSDLVYAGACGRNPGVYKSIDGGNNWFWSFFVSECDQPVYPYVLSMILDSGNNATLYVGTSQNTLVSYNSAESWSCIGDFGSGALGLSKTEPKMLYAGVNDLGCYRLLMEEPIDLDFRPNPDGWQFANTAYFMWPASWWNQFDYSQDPYPTEWTNWPINARSQDFPDWPLFVDAFGENQCYWNPPPGMIVYSPSAVLRWSQMKGDWGGSCFGFAISSYLAFDNKTAFLQEFPNVGDFNNLYDLTINDDRRKVINQLWIYQFGKSQQAHINGNIHKTPNQTLSEIKQMFLSTTRDDRILVFFNQTGSGGHAVNPYKVERSESNPSIEYIYIYDNNSPNDSNQRIIINTANNTWAYSAMPTWGGREGLFLMDPVSNYLSTPILPKQIPPRERWISNISVATNHMEFFNSPNISIVITDQNGNTIGYSDSTAFNEFEDGIPIIPITGSFHPPIGYFIPKGQYTIQMQNFADSSSYFSVFTDSSVYSYQRSDAHSTQTDEIDFGDGLVIKNQDAQSKRSHLETIIIEEDNEKVYQIEGCEISQNDSLRVKVTNGQDYQILNYGVSKNYNLKSHLVAENTDVMFEHDDIDLSSNASHLISPDWQNLENQPVQIFIDEGMDGTTDDTLFVENQIALVPYNFAHAGWYMVSFPVEPESASLTRVFPSTLAAFEWNGYEYNSVDSLETEKGYWLAMPSSEACALRGRKIDSYTRHYQRGWYLIGSVIDSVDFTDSNDQPDGSALTPAYRYDTELGRYVPADTLVPGKGYWIAVIQECDLTIGETSSSLSKPIAQADREAFYRQFGSQPPPPPTINWQKKEIITIAEKCVLLQNFPNPFNGQTVIRYQLPKSSRVILKIYNTLGKEVRTLVDAEKEAGYHWINWDGKNNDGLKLSSGIYIYRIQSGDFVMTKKMVFIM